MSTSSIETYWKYWPEIVDTMHGGLVLIRPNGQIVLINRALETMTGYKKNEIIGQTCTIFRCDQCEFRRKASHDYWCTLFEYPEKKLERCRCDLIRKDGGMLPVLKNASVLKDQGGEIIGAVETLTDITEVQKRDQKIEELSKMISSTEGFCGMIGRTPQLKRVFSLVEKASQSGAPVIITGESGTGKELVASAIHQLSDRREGPFIQLNCAALNESLLESELFGHVKGAFTGAYRHRTGRFEAADQGSVFLDEIGDMPMSTQVKLLRVLESQQVERVGDHKPIPINVRIIVATNRNLPDRIQQRLFREDLYFRINVIPIHLPALRDRREDIPLLIDSIIRELVHRTYKPITGLSKAAMNLFFNYDWAGNVRELKSVLEFAFVVAESGLIGPEHLPEYLLNNTTQGYVVDDSEDESENNDEPEEKNLLVQALHLANGNRTEAARILGITRTTVWNRIRKYNIKMEKLIRVK